ncbi:E3 ubiquitin-protein ligase RNF144B-like [Arachis ipaensis]|uniref:RBR-type E3 ubiquitin transferase n=1 Tax=Arachis hypogaea TaxID=3818 RepID=A0A444XCA3_ARAHY|nr:E3 ubiquitin-protein ligase RNF144B-like [Arachis ipaensis]QHN75781.1 E3 ubiquitin-protein ligase RNF144A-like isoform [Arachis hypogaea]RYQ87326.1 hypothetical protein Ahy_B09g094808 [Arachis hypogaea]
MTKVSSSNKNPKSPNTNLVRKRRKISKTENVDSFNTNTNSEPFFCRICTETKTKKESFTTISCNHSFCTTCMVKHVSSEVHRVKIPCPICMDRDLNVEDCRNILPKKVFDLWGKLLCEAGIPEDDKFYCPFKDCSALMIDDGVCRKLARKFKCPHCDRMFCAECKVAWHHGIRCKKFQSRNKDRMEKEDVMLMELAKKMQWQRCPNCKFYVEKTGGCSHMMCRCGETFLYLLGCGIE